MGNERGGKKSQAAFIFIRAAFFVITVIQTSSLRVQFTDRSHLNRESSRENEGEKEKWKKISGKKIGKKL